MHLVTSLQIKLTGPVECRLGMLLLTSPNITVLGGEVDNLMATNNQKSVLLRAMYVCICIHIGIVYAYDLNLIILHVKCLST